MQQIYRNSFYVSLGLLVIASLASFSYAQRLDSKIKTVTLELNETQAEISRWKQKKEVLKLEKSEQESVLKEQDIQLQSTQRKLMKEKKNTQEYQRVGEYLAQNVMIMNSCLESIASTTSVETSYEMAHVYQNIRHNCEQAGAMMTEIREIIAER